MAALKLPGPDSRVLIVGKTGSGKTVAAAWQLSERDYDVRPWVILDYKHEGLFAKIRGAEIISVRGRLPTEPGVYIVQPRPDEEGEVEAMLWAIWEQGGIGLYVDEGYMLPMKGKSPAFQAILTQGRSKQIPTITLSQRPVWISRFAISESSYYQVFWLTDLEDRKTIGRFIPDGVNNRLEDYHSIWYDVAQDRKAILQPVPSEAKILATFDRRLRALHQEPPAPRLRKL